MSGIEIVQDLPMKNEEVDATNEEGKPKRERPPAMHEGRVIIRNLVFDMRDVHLQKAFGKYGKID